MDLGPYALREHVGPAEEHEHVPAEYLDGFELLGDLSATGSVLEVGGGTGGLAPALFARPHLFRGRYCSFDADGHDDPGGTPDTFRLPYADAEFDVVVATSVFTHLLPAAAARYLQQIGRVLRPGGRALLSFVLLPREKRWVGPVAAGRLYRRVHAPQTVTFYGEDDVQAMAEAGGLSVSSVRPGTWSGHDGPAFQDLVLLTRR